MSTKRFLAITAFMAMLGLTTSASARHPRVATLHEGVHDIETRSKAVRHHSESAPGNARRETERAMAVVDRHRVSVTTRLELLEVLGQSDAADARTVMEMEKTLQAAESVLGHVERWYGIRPRVTS